MGLLFQVPVFCAVKSELLFLALLVLTPFLRQLSVRLSVQLLPLLVSPWLCSCAPS